MKIKKIWFGMMVILTAFGGYGATAAQAAEGAASQPTISGFQKFFIAGGWLVWFVLLPMSLLTVSLIIQYFLEIRRSKLLPPAVEKESQQLLEESQFQKAMDFLRNEGSMLSRALFVGLAESKNGWAAMENGMAEIMEQETTHLLRKIEWLNILGNVAPMVGLFGTVWGMIDAFNQIVVKGGQPEPADLAGGISVALVTTWWGLIIAIPALAAYGSLRNRIDSLVAEIAVSVENLLRNIHPNS